MDNLRQPGAAPNFELGNEGDIADMKQRSNVQEGGRLQAKYNNSLLQRNGNAAAVHHKRHEHWW